MSSYRENGTDVQAITDAQEAHTVDMRRRMIKYSVSMGIRMICIVLVFVVSGWLQWVFIVGAVVLPYFAVILANVGTDHQQMGPSTALLDRPPQRELGADLGSGSADQHIHDPGTRDDVLHGEVIDEEEAKDS